MPESCGREHGDANLSLVNKPEDIRMKKIALLATAALMATTGTIAFAQNQGGTPAPVQPAPQQENRQGPPRMSEGDFNRLLDARVAAIKAGLKLSADQERLWTPVENAIRTSATERFSNVQQRRENRDERRSQDFMQRLEQRSTRMTEGSQRFSAVATALRPLWDSFSEDQKRIAPRLMREAIDGGSGWNKRGGRHHGRDGRHAGMRHHGGDHGGPRGAAPQQ
jgi:hypothetical protein